jgi:hypothetical protein
MTAAEYAIESRREQQLPEHVVDSTTLERIAVLLPLAKGGKA